MTIPIVEETLVHLEVNGAPFCQWRCTPADLESLAIGRLYIDGWIGEADDASLHINHAGTDGIMLQARVAGQRLERVQPGSPIPIPPTEMFIELFRALFAGVDARHEHGGMHAAAATNGEAIIVQVEDVGRHNTIDKLIGAVLLRHLVPAQLGLLTSSRVSGEIADKAARAGFSWLASRSIPTTMAVDVAQRAHLPIIGRAASRDAHVYA
jgi:FdhD protein